MKETFYFILIEHLGNVRWGDKKRGTFAPNIMEFLVQLTYVKIIWYCMYMRIFNLQMPFFPKCTTLYFNQQYKNASIDSHPFDHWVLPEFLYLYSFQLGIYPGMDLLVMDSCIFNRNYQTISKAMI